MTRQLAAALALAKRGWPVFPCGIDKKPLVKNGFKVASTGQEQITAWWGQFAAASIGVPTGTAIGCFVLDVDLPDGPASLSALEKQHGPLPDTAEQRTGSGGRQLFFKMPPNTSIRNSAGKIGTGLDVRGDGGYVIVPPSGHPSGGRYFWTSQKGTAPADAPQWLLDLVIKPKAEPRSEPAPNARPSKNTSPYGSKALEDECAGVAMAAQGGRNQALNEAAFSVGGLVGGGEIDQTEAETALLGAALQAGLSEGEARKTISSGLQAGHNSPRKAPEKKSASKKPTSKSHGRAFPFSEGSEGVYFLEEQQDGSVNTVWVCSPLRVLALTRDSQGEEWGRLLEVVDSDGTPHQWAMPMTLLAGNGDTYRAQLLSMGLRLTPGIQGKNRLHMFLSLAAPEDRARCVNRIGWHGHRFVLPDAVYGHEQGERILLQGGAIDTPFRKSGTLREWQEQLGRYCVGNSRLTFAVSAALAAPLLHLTGAENGGFHLVGASSKGKTTLLQVAGSACGGGGLNGFLRQWRATSNGLEAVAAAHCDSLLCLDEMSQVASREAGEVAYMLSNGQGKTRAARTGEGRKPAEWRILFLSTGEISLADKVREDGRGKATAGQAVRVVDIPADAGQGLGLFEVLHGFPDGDRLARHLKEAARTIYGTPLHTFLGYIAVHHEDVAGAVNAAIRKFQDAHCPPNCDGQVVRVAGRFALVAAAGEQGIKAGVLPWEGGEAERAASVCFRAWLEERGGVGAAETEQAITQVRAFIEAHGASRFEAIDGSGDTRIINRAGYRQKTDLHTRYCFFPETFRREVCSGLNPKSVCKALMDDGHLVTDGGKYQKTLRTPDGAMKFYVVTSAILRGNSGNTPEITEEIQLSEEVTVEVTRGNSGGNGDMPDPASRCLLPLLPVTPIQEVTENSNKISAVTPVTSVTPNLCKKEDSRTPPGRGGEAPKRRVVI